MHRIVVTGTGALEGERDTAGGTPVLARNQEHPHCRICAAPLILFFQFDIQAAFGLDLETGSHLMVFMCPHHNDSAFERILKESTALPDLYWEQDQQHYALLLNRPAAGEQNGMLLPCLQAKRLTFQETSETVDTDGDFASGSEEFKVGGVPAWINFAIEAKCSCGGDMEFVCQVPLDFPFAQTAQAPHQPDGFSSTEYGLLLGNQVVILACSQQCHPRALMAVCDN